MTIYVKCRFCGDFIRLLNKEEPPFTIKEKGVEEAVCPQCFQNLVNFFKK